MTKLDWIRLLIHIPWGLASLLMMAYLEPLPVGIAAGCLSGFSFLAYEFIQEWRKHDRSHKDVIGFVAGLYMGAGIIYLTGVLSW